MTSDDGVNVFTGTLDGDTMKGKGRNTGANGSRWEWKATKRK